MTPENPRDAQKGKVDETTGKVAEEADEAKATTDAEATAEKPKRTRTKKTEEPAAEAPAKPRTERKRDRRPAPEPGVLVQARARYVRTSARKARLVCDHIRGKDVTEARAILAFT